MNTGPEAGAPHGSLTHIILHHGPAILRSLENLTRNADDAWELLNEACARLLKRSAPGEIRNTAAYLHATATNVYFERYHARKREKAMVVGGSDVIDAVSDTAGTVDDLDVAADAQRLLSSINHQLPERKRAALALHLEGYTHAEIARRLKTTPQAITQLLFVSRQQLAAILNGHGQGKEKP